MVALQSQDEIEHFYSEGATLELRQRGRVLRGRFPYNSTATVSDRGRQRKERIGPRAFSFAVEDEEREVHLLSGHSFSRPLASKRAGSLTLRDTDEALTFEAELPPEGSRPSWVEDTVKAVESGLVTGVSPGFRVPPADVVPGGERLIPEAPGSAVLVRVISAAVLHELSLVSRPAFPGTAVNLRADLLTPGAPDPFEAYNLWR